MVHRVALVTGANKSIGLVTVRAIAALGATVYPGSRDETAGQSAAEVTMRPGSAIRRRAA